ncbi:alpha/beta hydrolase [Mangrovimonas sp. AS39]|uniref:carboxylesterase family protein n=1 Tax=Mangrovimonas futianensis TaxID=2895523 RepID=UPI001E395640|nr:carboxylesterase family protein [Mangrovimonas futianensis]MCF1190042.1 alpha/beta hydrolase [Mangrovimonas futianensis]MCF1194207.1 alpha/beta hydrolase [Mangrovimonas futianensis]
MRVLTIALFLFLGVYATAQTKTTYTYSIKGKDTLKLDVYTPENIKAGDKLPTLLWMHGGGFSVGSRDFKDDAELCQYAAQYGYIGISISYRLLRKGIKTGFGCDCTKEDKLEVFKQAAIDYLDAAAFVVSNSNQLHVDTKLLIAGGSSAGAEGTLNAVFMKEHFADDLEKYKQVEFAGIFSCAGAIVNAEYITKENAIPSVFYHGTEDNLVPFASAPHHFCDPEKPGYLFLDGAKVIVDKLEDFETSYYFNIVKGGKHEISRIPYEELDKVFNFFQRTIINDEVIQTTIIKTKS